jgi:gamma-glutamyltranspeptidase/glutathione hydrolase
MTHRRTSNLSLRLVATFALPIMAGCASARSIPAPTPAPDAGKRLVAEHAVVSSANPLASDAGVEMLRAGGNAVDAAVATAFAVSVVEPQMSGLGGGGAMLIWLQNENRAEFVDFYAAQNAASWKGRTGGSPPLGVVAIPGEVAGLLEAHERFGKLTRAQVLAPAVRLAEQGAPVNQILAQMIASDSAKLFRFPESSSFYWPGGRPLAPGTVVRNPDLAATLRAIADRGRAGFYEGPVAKAVVDRLNAGGHPATLADLAAYEPRWRRPLCGDYRGRIVLSAPPPQTGSEIIHTLEMLERFDLPAMGLPTKSPKAFDVIASAMRVGIADNRANDDPAWEHVPAVGIASEGFARERGAFVGTGRATPVIEQGDASSFDDASPAPACRRFDPYPAKAQAAQERSPDAGVLPGAPAFMQPEGGETTHLSVVDADGNAVALTHTNSSVFGSGASAAGFFLNDSGYRFTEEEASKPTTTTWRVRTSTISPTIVLEDGRVKMVVGAPGGGRIPTAMLQTMVYTLDYGMDPLDAIRMPRIFPSPGDTEVELETGFPADVLRDIQAMGYRPAALSFGYARLYVVVRQGGFWVGAADPRHNGEVRGY